MGLQALVRYAETHGKCAFLFAIRAPRAPQTRPEKLRVLWAEGMSAKNIASELGYTLGSVYATVSRLGLPRRRKRRVVVKVITKEERTEIDQWLATHGATQCPERYAEPVDGDWRGHNNFPKCMGHLMPDR